MVSRQRNTRAFAHTQTQHAVASVCMVRLACPWGGFGRVSHHNTALSQTTIAPQHHHMPACTQRHFAALVVMPVVPATKRNHGRRPRAAACLWCRSIAGNHLTAMYGQPRRLQSTLIAVDARAARHAQTQRRCCQCTVLCRCRALPVASKTAIGHRTAIYEQQRRLQWKPIAVDAGEQCGVMRCGV